MADSFAFPQRRLGRTIRMTSRSPRKHRITVPTFRRRKPIDRLIRRVGWLAAVIALVGVAADSQTARGQAAGLHNGRGPATASASGSTTQPGWNLRWRRSPQVTPDPVHVPATDVFATPQRRRQPPPAAAVRNPA